MFGFNPAPTSARIDIRSVLGRRHPEHREFEQTWRWLLDSLEGGPRYRDAQYPSLGGGHYRNLIRHERETPRPRQGNEVRQLPAGGPAPEVVGELFGDRLDAAAESTYETRLARTPVPTMVPEVVDKYRSRIYSREIKRDYGDPVPDPASLGGRAGPAPASPSVPVGPARPGLSPPRVTPAGSVPGNPASPAPAPAPAPQGVMFPVAPQPRPQPAMKDQFGQALDEFWRDVDGAGTTADDWMGDTIAPLLITLGCLDIYCVERPLPPGTAAPESLADYRAADLDKPVVGYILPDNMLWWRLDPTGRNYVECLTREFHPGDDGVMVERFRHWLPGESTIYDGVGQAVADPVPHPGGIVPIVRIFDRRNPRTTHCGIPRMGPVAEIQRDYYNRDSELVLNDIMQSSPILSGPADYLTGSVSITVGSGYCLPKIRVDGASGRYEGWEFVTPPKGGDQSIRQNLDRRRDEADRITCQTKPAGVAAGGSGTVSQSGVSKQLDQEDGNNLLGKLSRALAKAEDQIATLYLRVRFGRDSAAVIDRQVLDRIRITYPQRFNLYGPAETLDLIAGFQRILAGAGTLPTADGAMLQIAIRQILVGFDDDAMVPIDAEIDQHVTAQAGFKQQQRDQFQESGLGPNQDTDDPGSTAQVFRAFPG